VKATDISGRVLQTKIINAGKGENIIQLDVRKNANGIYFVKFVNELKQIQTIQLTKL